MKTCWGTWSKTFLQRYYYTYIHAECYTQMGNVETKREEVGKKKKVMERFFFSSQRTGRCARSAVACIWIASRARVRVRASTAVCARARRGALVAPATAANNPASRPLPLLHPTPYIDVVYSAHTRSTVAHARTSTSIEAPYAVAAHRREPCRRCFGITFSPPLLLPPTINRIVRR